MSNKNKRMLEKDGYYIISDHDYNDYGKVGSNDTVTKIILGIIIITLVLMFIA